MVTCSICKLNNHNARLCHNYAIMRATNIINNNIDPNTGNNWIENENLKKPVGFKLIQYYYTLLNSFIDYENIHQGDNIVLKLKSSYFTNQYDYEFKYVHIFRFKQLKWIYFNRAEYKKHLYWNVIKDNTIGEILYEEYNNFINNNSSTPILDNVILDERRVLMLLDEERYIDRYFNNNYNIDYSLQLSPISNKCFETSICSICLENLGNTNKIILRCGHQYCVNCIVKHAKNDNNLCPTCRCRFI